MPTAEPLPDNIRRIAVLVASVDSVAARQLLLHLPTSVAKQVRRALQNLGPISPAERQRILNEFQTTAAKQSQLVTSQPNSAPIAQSSVTKADLGPNTNDIHTNSHASAQSPAEHSAGGESPLYSALAVMRSSSQHSAPENSQPAWKRMDIGALSRFLRGERATVIAVVVNQLSPDMGVKLLQQLPASTHREVLQTIASLQDIDDEVMQSIEEHLAERLKDYEQQATCQAKGSRRVAALLAAAPPDLQETWSRFVHIAIDASQDNASATQPRSELRTTLASSELVMKHVTASTNMSPSDLIESPIGSQVDTTRDTQAPASAESVADSNLDDDPYILPFYGPNDARPLSDTDRSLIQLEFEQILSLSTHQLAQVLTSTNSQTVLLALAGASPSFMKRFYAMLGKADGKALAARLSHIGPLKLRDIDEAQRGIAELAAKLLSPRSNLHRTSPPLPLRVAA